MEPLQKHINQLRISSLPKISDQNFEQEPGIYSSSYDFLEIKEKFSKKVGPAVPPKPVKDTPEVPKSSKVQHISEPLYSKRLQMINTHINDSEKNSILSAQSLLFKENNMQSNPNLKIFKEQKFEIKEQVRQPAYEQQHHVYSNMKMTLDNPAILDQQLEALEHHKRQLERKGLLPSVNKGVTSGPKLSSASYITSEFGGLRRTSSSPKVVSPIIENQSQHNSQNLISKLKNCIPSDKKFEMQHQSNISRLTSGQNIVYSNILHLNNKIQKNNKSLNDGNNYPNLQYNWENLPQNQNLNVDRPSVSFFKSSRTGMCSENYIQQETNSATEEENTLPPSPVSSSYSELRRATDNYPQLPIYPVTVYQNDLEILNQTTQNPSTSTKYNDYSTYGGGNTHCFSQSTSTSDYYGFGSPCQGSSTYESIYEPITINRNNQTSLKSNFSLYTSYENITQNGTERSPRHINDHFNLSCSNNICNSKTEIEIHNFSNLIVNPIDSGSDIESYGSCVKCGERVVGESSGCTAMDQIYHISCFTCTQCQINLQGKPFYALENKPYCEEDYLNTLEKCSVCMKPILERILRATGKPYHPKCFTCVVCDNSLDGIPFTVDATNQNYCIQDFHKKFAPRCCVCCEPIMPNAGEEETVRVVALDKSFHFECYKCEDCELLLSSEAEGRGCYPLDDHVLCKSCNAKRVQTLTNRIATEI